MSILTIYTPVEGELFKQGLDAVVSILNEGTFHSAISIVSTFAVLLTAYQYIVGKKFEAITRYLVTGFFATYVLLGIKVPVAILDMQHPDSAQSAQTVDHVPIGLALPASIISTMGNGITLAFQSVFHTVDDLDFVKSGMIFGSRVFLALSASNLTPNPNLLFDMSAYLRQCVFTAKLLGSNSIAPNELVHSDNLESLYFNDPSPIYRVVLHDGSNVSCIDAVGGKDKAGKSLRTQLSAFVDEELKRVNKVMDKKKNIGAFRQLIEHSHEYYTGIATSAAETLTQNILINATRDAARDAFAFSGADAALMNYTNTQSMQKMHIAEANTFWLACLRLPYYMTIIWMLMVCLFPLILLLSLVPLAQNVYTIFLQSQIYIWSWPPMLVIIHFFVSISGNVPISSSEIEKIKITFSNSDVLSSHHANFAYTAGALAASVPFLAYFITKGLSFVLNNAAQHFGGIAQSLSVGEAQSAATGNVSMASYSGWNMNYDNTNAHKFDTNRTHFEGMSSQQMPNGAISTDTQDGSHIANVLPAISNSAVSVHGSDRVVDALHQSANESFNTASQLRTSADTHAQEGLNQLKNFSENDSNDYRSGAGVSNTTTDSINQDLRNMKDAVHAYNKHHDVSSQTSVEAAAAYRLNTNKAIWGKGVELATGSSIDASVTGRTQGSTTHSAQWFNNSSEGQAFNESFNHMMNTARHNNLDTTDNHNLSGSEQIAANFATSESLLKQSSSEYSHGMQLQNAASHAKEQSSSIDDNLNQPFHDWALQHHPESGKQVMLGTDLESIRTQHQWANDFLDSSTGKSAINNQVHAALERSASSLKADYQSNAAELENTSHIHQKYAKDSDAVDMKADQSKLERINPVQMESLQSLHRDQQSKTIEADAKKTADYVNLRLDDVDKKIEHLPLNKEK